MDKGNGFESYRQPEGEITRQPEVEVARQAKFFQPTQPISNPIRDRSGQPDMQDVIVVQDERKTSPSQEISVNSFNKEPSSSDRTGRLVETEETEALSSEDSKGLNVEQTHVVQGDLVKTQLQYKTTLKCIMRPKRFERLTLTSKFQDYRILL